MSLIFIIGMPGSGKTFWGKTISMLKGVPFIDMDEQLEVRENIPVTRIFKEYGEAMFREKEHDLLVDIIKTDEEELVVACGGGTPCFKDNMALMKQNGIVIYLKANASFLADKLKDQTGVRPLLAGHTNIKARLEELLNERSAIYEQADHILDVDSITASTFDKILRDV